MLQNISSLPIIFIHCGETLCLKNVWQPIVISVNLNSVETKIKGPYIQLVFNYARKSKFLLSKLKKHLLFLKVIPFKNVSPLPRILNHCGETLMRFSWNKMISEIFVLAYCIFIWVNHIYDVTSINLLFQIYYSMRDKIILLIFPLHKGYKADYVA